MQKRSVEVAIIGTGTAGMAAYTAARVYTRDLALIEEGPYGTTCARVGCMPSKLLIAAAERAHEIRKAPLFGVGDGEVSIDGRAVMTRVKRERDRFVEHVLQTVESYPEADRIRGRARFTGPNRLQVGDDLQLTAKRIVIATGSRPNIPEPLKAAGERLLVSDDVFEWNQLPESVAVFGPGVIGLELGQALCRLGVRVRLFGRGGSLGSLKEKPIRDYALRTFNEEFPLAPKIELEEIRPNKDGVEIRFVDPEKGPVTERFSYLLATTGRRPNLDRLDLGRSGLELDDKGVPLFNRFTLQCGESPVFIAGDADSELPLLHEAADTGRIAGDNAGRYPDLRAGQRRTPLTVVFTDPQIATVGLSLEEARARAPAGCAVGSASFENQGRSRVMARNRGLLHVYGERGSGLFLGAEIFGPEAEHLAHLLAWAAQRHLTVSEMLALPFYHPVVEEALRTALRDLNHCLHMGPGLKAHCMDCGPGG